MKYRSDIDGLRAVAVISVVVFHLGFRGVATGGFVGVDVFFVISGYLITRIIYEDMARGTYRISDFYVRRARRILPAAIPVYLATLVAAALLLFGSERTDVMTSTLSSLGFVSNFYLLGHSGYFERAASFNPMLHTWSLSVEEQFYLVLPLAIFLLRHRGPKVRAVAFVAATALSFLAACFFLRGHSSAVFYLLPFRAWELLLGSLLAIGAVPAIRSRAAARFGGLLGLALIAVSVVLLDSQSLFPGWNALPACLGAALVIHFGADGGVSLSGRLLSWRPLRLVGLISYSLYLWHWPMIVFYSYLFGELVPVTAVALVGATFVVAWLSWRFVERPFRRPLSPRASRPRILAVAAGALVLTSLVTLSMPRAAAAVSPLSAAQQSLLRQQSAPGPEWRADRCFLYAATATFDDYDTATCLGDAAGSDGRRRVLLLGDSHAAQYYPGLVSALPGEEILQATASGCRPVLPLSGKSFCTAVLRYAIEDWLPRQPDRIDTIVVAARWDRQDPAGLAAMVDRLRPYARQVVVLGPIVQYILPLPRLLVAAEQGIGRPVEAYRVRDTRALDRSIAAVATSHGATFVSVYDTLCPDRCTTTTSSGAVMQFDYGHLSPAGSRAVMAMLAPVLRESP